MIDVDRLRDLAADIPAGPWSYDRVLDGLVLYDERGEPLALLYAGLPLARYLRAVAPAILLAEGERLT
jgi:hypothetical protein